jgi:hypothetical protein
MIGRRFSISDLSRIGDRMGPQDVARAAGRLAGKELPSHVTEELP